MTDVSSANTFTDGVVSLRPLTQADAEAHLAGEDDEQRKWLWADTSLKSTLDGVRQFIERSQDEWRTGAPRRGWGVREVETDALIGSVEVRDRGDGSANISVAVHPAYRGRGYASRAVRMASRYAHEAMGLNRAVAIISEENLASRRVAESVGFVLDGPAEAWEDDYPNGVMLRYVLRFQ